MLSTFPHLTPSDFHTACTQLSLTFQRHTHAQTHWTSVETLHHHDTTYLRITKPLQPGPPSTGEKNVVDDDVSDDDEERLIVRAPPAPTIHYDVVLSPTYRVPALYVGIEDSLHRYAPTMATLHDHVIPAAFRAQTDGVGVMGGVTMTEHPGTGRVVFHVHPCRTAEVMCAAVGTQDGQVEMTGEGYLMVWMGAMGGCVGLNVPLALAQTKGCE